MRPYSREIKSTYYKFQNLPRNFTQDKRMAELHTLKDSEVRIGKYKYNIDDELGKGYSSRVFKGIEIEKIHKRYAIKVVELKKFRGSNLEMLEAEIEIHKSLDHENVVKLYEVLKTSHHYYIVLEYCPHGNLLEFIHQKKKLTESCSIEIMDQIISGYKYLMKEGVIHRDIKPSNILRVGNKWKISDFGFAIKSKYGFKDRLNVGTPLYMAPESLKKNYYSAKADIFSLGCTLYQMVEGKTPWESQNQKQLIEKLNQQLSFPTTIKHAKIKEFIVRCCQINESKRMNAEQFEQFDIKLTAIETLPSKKSIVTISTASNSLLKNNLKSSLREQPSALLFTKLTNQFIGEGSTKLNTECLQKQLCFVLHIYSCLKNIDSFLIEAESKQIFLLTLYKLLLRLIRLLMSKSNNYNLANWEEYLESSHYKEFYQDVVSHSQKFQKEYLEYIQHNDIKIIRQVNRKFPQLCHHAPLSVKFFQNIKHYLIYLLRENNHELLLLYTSNQGPLESKKQQKGGLVQDFLNELEGKKPEIALVSFNDKIQALEALYTIYRIAELKSTEYNEITLEKISVISNYHESKKDKIDYISLRRLLRSI